MAIVKCHECGNEVSSTAAACPKCGAPPKPQAKSRTGANIFWLFMLLGGILIYPQLRKAVDEHEARKAALQPSPAAASENDTTQGGFDIVDFACSGEGAFSWASGHVRNNTGSKVTAIRISASFYGANKTLIDTGWSYAHVRPVLPGQSSPFKVYGPHGQNVKSCSIDSAQP